MLSTEAETWCQAAQRLPRHLGPCRSVSLQRRRFTTAKECNKGASSAPPPSRRDLIMASVNFAVLGSTANTPDIRTAVNSLLGAYGLPRLKDTPGFKYYDDFDTGYGFEYPRAWVLRANRQRKGLYVSDFNTADKATLEIFEAPDSTDLTNAVVSRHSNPAQEIGGDARLLMPPQDRIQVKDDTIDGQAYRYLTYPTETVTRSGYQIQRKNLAVAAVRQGVIYTLNASSRSDQMNKEKQATLQHIIESFRLRPS